MATATAIPASARNLLAALAPFGPVVEGEELAFDDDPPAALDAVLRVIHTGVRAQLAGRRWLGCDEATGLAVVLNPAATLPSGVTLLAVEGDATWDRINPAAWCDAPRLFDPAPGPSGRG
ncbi:hypothetical protein [Urbifossiella limnaea]|uniref:Uncharacterized protein n=1 Tax=Urbifossiella limnaea TaxID=2528023 RepID=A0A517Y0V5_9BACT|nr:hypothetical protein [Urbifossiella limnaea]QDU23383.1 hypothetical protein ETAA1_53820 [Urbifossiella limnaea]